MKRRRNGSREQHCYKPTHGSKRRYHWVVIYHDHSGEGEDRNEDAPTRLLIFGNPQGGTPLMLAAPTSTIVFPLKILVGEDANSKSLDFLQQLGLSQRASRIAGQTDGEISPRRSGWLRRRQLSDMLNWVVAERWQSGRLRQSRKLLNLHGFREFESPPLRHSGSHARQEIQAR